MTGAVVRAAGKGVAAMADTSIADEQESQRYPLSFTQEWFLTMDKGDDGGPFGGHYLLASAYRITGAVDVAVLQGALDDVVARHELLRTVVVRDADPPYQQVCPPCRVPLEIRDLRVTGGSRDKLIQELILEVQTGTISAREVPLMKALLARFDDRDSVLFLVVHHSVCDGWSFQVILRDLGTFYAARISGTPPKLPQMRQYREYVQWQLADAASMTDDNALRYWTGKLKGSREFVMPNDHGRPERYSRPWSLHFFTIEPGTMAAAADLAKSTRGTVFIVMLSAIYVLAHQITGATDLAVNAVTAGRNELQFHNTMGLFLNVLPYRTEIADCTSFRDVVLKTRETFIDAMAHELPTEAIVQTVPDYIRSRGDMRMSQLLISVPQSQHGGDQMILPIAEGAKSVAEVLLEQTTSFDVPSGTVWYLNMRPDGSLGGGVHFNLDEFAVSTAEGWSTGLKRILASAVLDPGQDWREL